MMSRMPRILSQIGRCSIKPRDISGCTNTAFRAFCPFYTLAQAAPLTPSRRTNVLSTLYMTFGDVVTLNL